MFHVLCDIVEGHWVRVRRMENRVSLFVVLENNAAIEKMGHVVIFLPPHRAKAFFLKGLKLCKRIGFPKNSPPPIPMCSVASYVAYDTTASYQDEEYIPSIKITKVYYENKHRVYIEMNCKSLFLPTTEASIMFGRGLDMCESWTPHETIS